MEIAIVRQRVHETMERAKRRASERRTRNDEATRSFAGLLDRSIVPLFRQIANVLKVDGYAFTVFTPASSVRLMSDRNAEDFIEIALDTSGDEPKVTGHTSRSRGRRVVDAERIVAAGDPETLTEDDVLAFVLKELEPFVER